MLKVKLKAVPNPDYPHGHYNADIRVDEILVDVLTLEEASRKCREFIETHDLGGGNWAGGEVLDRTGLLVGYVSYNGRTWPAGERIG